VKILFVAPWIPSSLRPRSLSVLSLLATEHEVHFLAAVRTDNDRRLAEELTGCASVTVVDDRRWRSVMRVGLALLRGKSLQTAYANSRALRGALADMLSRLDPDVVHFNVFRTAHLVPLVRGATSVIDLDEYRSEYYEQLALYHPGWIWRTLGKYEAKRMSAGEKRLQSSRCTILLSAPRSPEMPSNVFHVPSVSLLPATDSAPIAPAAQTVTFVGRLTYEANQDAIRWFVDECWEGVLAAVPSARLLVVGDRPPRDIADLAGKTISVTGHVASVAPYYQHASVVVAPIRRATGVQMKLIEGLSFGKPVVCTPLVARLAGVRHGEEVLVAADPTDWISAVVGLLRDPATAASVGARGRRWVDANHSRETQRMRLTEAYSSAIVRRVSRGA
jgi:glycosyltransferase involved in cell wall biosynthesis